MDIANVSAAGAVSAALAQQQVYAQNEAGVSMLKKAIDTQAANALSLIASVPQLPQTSAVSNQGLPANLGQHINRTV